VTLPVLCQLLNGVLNTLKLLLLASGPAGHDMALALSPLQQFSEHLSQPARPYSHYSMLLLVRC
jgi:hypothetical protein